MLGLGASNEPVASTSGTCVRLQGPTCANSGFAMCFCRSARFEYQSPKWIFRNISAIRENTERILQMLESERTLLGLSLRKAPLPEPKHRPSPEAASPLPKISRTPFSSLRLGDEAEPRSRRCAVACALGRTERPV